jgi:hypothetical protein
MQKLTIIFIAAAVVTVGAVAACNSDKNPSQKTEGIAEISTKTEVKGIDESSSKEAQVEKGRYLVTIMACQDCHSPKIMTPHGPEIDTAHMLSGHPASLPVPKVDASLTQSWVLFNQNMTAFVGPWGISFAANLTSDETGIGNWSESQFIKAIRQGKLKGMDNTRPLLPPMPWPIYKNATDEDLKAIFAYLKTVPPVENRVPAPIPPNQLAQMK